MIGLVAAAGLAQFWRAQVRAALGDDKARVRANLGKAYLAAGRADEAEAELRRAIELEPTMSGAYVTLANLYIDQRGDLEEGERILRTVLEREPGYPTAVVSLGVVHLRDASQPGGLSSRPA